MFGIFKKPQIQLFISNFFFHIGYDILKMLPKVNLITKSL